MNPSAKDGRPELSVIIPFYNEAGNIAPLLEELRATLAPLSLQVEVWAIDDGSRDTTGAELSRLAAGWDQLHVKTFATNRGQAAALWWGFGQASAPWIAMLDGDGQNPPAELARLWEMRESADMLAGQRTRRRDSWLRRMMSSTAYLARQALLRDRVRDAGCSLKIFRREVRDSFLPVRTLYSFLPAFAASAGWRVRPVPVAHRARQRGQSKYGLRAMAVYPALDLLALAWILRRRFPLPPSQQGESVHARSPDVSTTSVSQK